MLMANEDKNAHKYFEDQFDDENVLFVFRKHPIVMRKGIVLWALGMLAGPLVSLIQLYVFKQEVSVTLYMLELLGGFILSLLLFAPSYIGWYFSVFIITDQRFITITQKGLFHRGVADVGLHQVQSLCHRIFLYCRGMVLLAPPCRLVGCGYHTYYICTGIYKCF